MSTEFVLDWIGRKVGFARLPPMWSKTLAARGAAANFEPLVIATALFFDRIDAGVLADLLDIDERQLATELQILVDCGILHRLPMRRRMRFVFADPALRAAAVSAIPEDARASLHRDAARALSRQDAFDDDLAIAIEAARHCQACGEWIRALDGWREAAQTAAADGNPKSAAACLDEALAICRDRTLALPPRQEILTLSALGPLQAQLTGSGSDDVAQIYARCLAIAEGIDASEAASLFDVLWGLSASILVHGRVGTALELCERLLSSAEASCSDEQVLLSNRLKGLGQLLAGQILQSIETLSEVVRMYEFGAHAALRFSHASDQSALALAHLSWGQAIAGDLARSAASRDQALAQARKLEHPHTSAHVTCVLAARAQTLGLRADAATLATAGQALARHHGYPYWQAWADMILGWHEGGRNPQTGMTRIEEAIADYQRTGAGQALPFAHLLRAGLALDHGWRAQAAAAAGLAVEFADAHGVEMFDAEILRIRALALFDGDDQRQLLLEQAHRTALRQGATLFAGRITAARCAPALNSSPRRTK